MCVFTYPSVCVCVCVHTCLGVYVGTHVCAYMYLLCPYASLMLSYAIKRPSSQHRCHEAGRHPAPGQDEWE